MAFNPQKYGRDFAASMALYASVLFASRIALRALDPEGVAQILLAAAPTAPAALTVFVVLRHFATMDEMQRRIQIEAFCAGALFTGLATFSLGFLEDAGLPRLSMIWVMPGMIAAWGVLLVIVRNRYR